MRTPRRSLPDDLLPTAADGAPLPIPEWSDEQLLRALIFMRPERYARLVREIRADRTPDDDGGPRHVR
jgi:hypothetical protein